MQTSLGAGTPTHRRISSQFDLVLSREIDYLHHVLDNFERLPVEQRIVLAGVGAWLRSELRELEERIP